MKKYIFSLLAALACMSCEKTIDVNVPLEDSKLVLHSYLNPDSTLKAQLSSSVYALDEMEKRPDIADASLVVFEDEKELGSMEYRQNGWYELPGFKPKEGRNYRIEAEKTGFDKVSASEKVLEAVAIGPVAVDTVFEQQDGYSQQFVEVTFSIIDQTGENFYIPTATHYVKVRGINHYTGVEETMEINNSYRLESSEPYVESYCYHNCITLVTDSYVDGKNIQVKLRGWMQSFPPEWTILEERYYVKLYHVSPSYYLYQATLYNNYENAGNPFAEPTPVFSNVDGGYGVLGSLNSSYKEF